MLLSGLWHGAAWHFLMWAALHSFYLSIERVTKWPDRLKKTQFGKFIAMVVMMILVTFAWVFFRAETTHQAFTIAKYMLTSFTPDLGLIKGLGVRPLFVCILMMLWELRLFFGIDGYCAKQRILRVAEPVFIALIFTACVYLRGQGNTFIYFQF